MTESTMVHHEYRRILVPLDGSTFAEEALAYAVALSPRYSPMLLLRVIAGEQERSSPKHVFGGSSDEEVRKERREALEYLLEAAKVVRDNGALVRSIASVAVGDPAEQIIRTAHDRGCTLIVMSSHGRGAVGRLAYGSVADRVARTSPVPVLIVRPNNDDEVGDRPLIQRLVVPLDGSTLSMQALPVALHLASEIGVPIRLVSVANLWGNDSLSALYPAGLSPRLDDEVMVDTERDLGQMLASIKSQVEAEGVGVELQVMGGPIAQAIMAATWPSDIVVMSSHGRSGFSRFILGSVAEKLIRECKVPVLLVPTVPKEAKATSLATHGAVAMST
jgi:nucleotide-binding universal stress UspA family protein